MATKKTTRSKSKAKNGKQLVDRWTSNGYGIKVVSKPKAIKKG